MLDLFGPQAAAKNLALVLLSDEDVPSTVLGDVTRVRQILVNLVSNAIKFTAQGEIVVRCSAQSLEPGRAELLIAVQDTGIGIPAARMHRLFQSFSQVDSSTTREFGGTGLGLAISRRLADLMGARLWVDSKAGLGSTFYLSLPVDVDTSVAPLQLPAIFSGKRVLVVDNSPNSRLMLRGMLAPGGIEVGEAKSGQEALDLLAGGETWDLVIIDQSLPDISSLDMARQIRAMNVSASLPLLLLVSHPAQLTDADRATYTMILSRPVKAERLRQQVAGCFGLPSPLPRAPDSLFDQNLSKLIPLRILVAEDNAVNQRLAVRLLERMGYLADVAFNGEEALDALQRQSYDVVLMDVQMPRMDGLEATRQIRQRWGNDAGIIATRIIAMTANAAPGDRELCLAAGMDDYITKPVNVSELQEALRRCARPTN